MIYEPREDSFLIKEQIIKLVKNKSVLDLGSGSGILAEAAINAGASSVLASDINTESVKFIKSKGIKVIQSNLFDKIKGKFDIIVFNPPYLPQDNAEGKEASLVNSGGKKGDEITIKFLNQAKEHLNKHGSIIILLSSLTPRDRISKLLGKLQFTHKVLASKKLFMEFIEVWKIEEQ